MKSFFIAIGLIVLIAGGVFVGRFTGSTPIVQVPPLPTFPTQAPTARPTITTSAGVIRQVQRLSRLETTKYSIETVVKSEHPGGWFGIGSEKILILVRGTVIAGVDLGKLTVGDVTVSEDGKSVTIRCLRLKFFPTA